MLRNSRTLVPVVFAATLATVLPIALSGLAPLALGRTAEEVVTPDLATLTAVIGRAAAAYGDRELLVAFDLDNTILATDTNFGGEQWFLWQKSLLDAGTPQAARTIPELLNAQRWIYEAAPMHAVDPGLPAAIAAFQARGIRFIVLTSRSLDVRDATQRELARNGYDFARQAPGPVGGFSAPYIPAVLPSEPLALPVLFDRGVLLTQGQNKGTMLRSLLEKTGATPKAIVMIDDRQPHLDGVQAVFKDREEAIYTLRFSHEAEHIAAFLASEKSVETAQWCAFSRGLAASIFVNVKTLPFLACAETPAQ